MTNLKVFRFITEVYGDVVSSDGPMFIYGDNDELLGAFNAYSGNKIIAHVSGANHPAALKVSEGEPFYFTTKPNQRGQVAYGILSEFPIGTESVKVVAESD